MNPTGKALTVSESRIVISMQRSSRRRCYFARWDWGRLDDWIAARTTAELICCATSSPGAKVPRGGIQLAQLPQTLIQIGHALAANRLHWSMVRAGAVMAATVLVPPVMTPAVPSCD